MEKLAVRRVGPVPRAAFHAWGTLCVELVGDGHNGAGKKTEGAVGRAPLEKNTGWETASGSDAFTPMCGRPTKQLLDT